MRKDIELLTLFNLDELIERSVFYSIYLKYIYKVNNIEPFN